MEHLIRGSAPSFAVEVFGHSVMSNHYHLVLKNDPGRAADWTAREVVKRWAVLYPKRKADGEKVPWSDEEIDRKAADTAWVEVRCERLGGISWLMKIINERVSRRANQEDGCTDALWEGHYKATALLDQATIIAAMAYVDLNPIHAKMAETPERQGSAAAIRRPQHPLVRIPFSRKAAKFAKRLPSTPEVR